MATLTYKGYTAVLEVDLDADELFGRTVGTRDIITFQGKTVEEARKSFEESIDFYLACCRDEGKQPDRPYSGRFNVRIAPEIHRELAILAQSRGQSLNELVSTTLADLSGKAPSGTPTLEPTWRRVKTRLEAQRPKAKPSANGHKGSRSTGATPSATRRRRSSRSGSN